MERKTGATDAQIEAGKDRLLGNLTSPQMVGSDHARERSEMWAKYLVPSTSRIVEDWPEVAAALERSRAVVLAAQQWREADADESGTLKADLDKDQAMCDLIDAIDAITAGDLDRLAALIGDGE